MPEGARDEEHDHEGSFAEGQEQAEHHPEAEHEGDFAEGQERRGNAERDPGVAPEGQPGKLCRGLPQTSLKDFATGIPIKGKALYDQGSQCLCPMNRFTTTS